MLISKVPYVLILFCFFFGIRTNAQNGTASSFHLQQEFYHELDLKADEVYNRFVDSGMLDKQPLWMLAKNAALFRIKQLAMVKSWIERAGKGPMRTVLVMEILTTGVLPPIFTALGQPAVAAISAAMPWGVALATPYAAFNIYLARLDVSKNLSGVTLSELEALRNDAAGFNVKERVSTVVYDYVENQIQKSLPIEVVKSLKTSASVSGLVVSIQELEVIVLQAGSSGAEYVKSRKLDRLQPALYSAELLRFVSNDSQSLAKLNKIIVERGGLSGTYDHALKSVILKFDDVKKSLSQSEHLVEEFLGDLKQAKKSKLSAEDFKLLRVRLYDSNRAAHEISMELQKAEFMFLNQLYLVMRKGGALGLGTVSDVSLMRLIKKTQEVMLKTLTESVKSLNASRIAIESDFSNKSGVQSHRFEHPRTSLSCLKLFRKAM